MLTAWPRSSARAGSRRRRSSSETAFGGTVAVAMALRHGDKFGKLVLSDVAAAFPLEGRKAFEVTAAKVAREGIGSVATISANRVFHEAYLAAHPEAIEQRRSVLLGIAGGIYRGVPQSDVRGPDRPARRD
jgi:pimeloyl-ACP methyl ester carboxylesterase